MKGFTGLFEAGSKPKYQRSYGTYNRKFPADKVEYADEAVDLMFDGVLLNASELCREYKKMTVRELLLCLWQQYGPEMLSRMKGSFVLSLLDKCSGQLFVSNDRLSRRPVYYSLKNGKLCFSSRFLDLVSLLAEMGVYPDHSPLAYEMMARDGQLYDRFTYLKDVYWLRPYEYLLGDETGVCLAGGEPDYETTDKSMEELLPEFESRFREAVRLQCEKNREAGYGQMASASGGMDSRSVILMADRLGCPPELCFCYAQKGAADETIARQVAESVGAEFFFYALDSAEFLRSPEEHGLRNECQISYSGATGARTVSQVLDLDRIGIVHIGIWGGEVMGDVFRTAEEHPPVNSFTGESAAEFAPCLETYASQERLTLFKYLRGSQNFVRMFEDRAEAMSPFMDEDVYEFIRTVPVPMRTGRRFYTEWMKRYLPNSFKATHCKTRVDAPRMIQLAARATDKILRKLKGQTGWSMTPVERWLAETPGLRALLEEKSALYAKSPMPEESRSMLLQRCSEPGNGALYAVTGLLAAFLIHKAKENSKCKE